MIRTTGMPYRASGRHKGRPLHVDPLRHHYLFSILHSLFAKHILSFFRYFFAVRQKNSIFAQNTQEDSHSATLTRGPMRKSTILPRSAAPMNLCLSIMIYEVWGRENCGFFTRRWCRPIAATQGRWGMM